MQMFRKATPGKQDPERELKTVHILMQEVYKRSTAIKGDEPCNFDMIIEGKAETQIESILSVLKHQYGGVVHESDAMGMVIVCADAWHCVVGVQNVRPERRKLVRLSSGKYTTTLICKQITSLNFHALGCKSGIALRACVGSGIPD